MKTEIIQFLSHHFEEIMAVTVAWTIGYVGVLILVRLSEIRAKQVRRAFNKLLLYVVTVGQILLVFLTVSIFVLSWVPKKPLDFTSEVMAMTEWVKDDLTIYFINENELVTIAPDGSGRQTIFATADLIREYHFSPDGKNLLIVTDNDLFQYDPQNKTSLLIDSLGILDKEKVVGWGGVINGIEWAPDSATFCYRVARWSKVSSLDQWYIYNITTKEKRLVQNPSLKIGYMIWDESGTNLYYSWFQALDTTVYANPFEVKVYKIPLATLKPELVNKSLFHEAFLPEDSLDLRGIVLFSVKDQLSFGRAGRKHYSWHLKSGTRIGIDEKDFLYYIRNTWWRRTTNEALRFLFKSKTFNQYREVRLAKKRLHRFLTFRRPGTGDTVWSSDISGEREERRKGELFYIQNRWLRKRLYRIPRIPVEADIQRHQYRGGDLAVQHLRWLPSGRYVIMEHHFFGILILEPASGKIGVLTNEKGNTFGWYNEVL